MSDLLEDKILNICNDDYKDLMNLENVNGLALGEKYLKGSNTGEICIEVFVEKKMDKSIVKSKDLIPNKYMGITTDVIEIGNVKALSLRDRIRPMKFGYSIGVEGYNFAGTAGCLVKRGEDYFILSNNHVIAATNLAPLKIGITQPSPAEGANIPNDIVANLTEFIAIEYDDQNGASENFADAAISKVLDISKISSKIESIGRPLGVKDAVLNSSVKKTGRTTGFTTGNILGLGSTVRVDYTDTRVKKAIFKNQIIANGMSNSGDSGSLVLDNENYAIGLLFAGSETKTVINKIDLVLSLLNVELVL